MLERVGMNNLTHYLLCMVSMYVNQVVLVKSEIAAAVFTACIETNSLHRVDVKS